MHIIHIANVVYNYMIESKEYVLVDHYLIISILGNVNYKLKPFWEVRWYDVPK